MHACIPWAYPADGFMQPICSRICFLVCSAECFVLSHQLLSQSFQSGIHDAWMYKCQCQGRMNAFFFFVACHSYCHCENCRMCVHMCIHTGRQSFTAYTKRYHDGVTTSMFSRRTVIAFSAAHPHFSPRNSGWVVNCRFIHLFLVVLRLFLCRQTHTHTHTRHFISQER